MLCLYQCSLAVTTSENKNEEQDTHTQCKIFTNMNCYAPHGFNILGKFKRLLYEIYLVMSNNVLSQCSLNCVDYFGVQLCEILRKIKKN